MFLWVPPPTKIKCTNLFFSTNHYVYDIFVRVHIHMQLLDAYCFVVLFLNLTMPFHTNEIVVYHEASPSQLFVLI